MCFRTPEKQFVKVQSPEQKQEMLNKKEQKRTLKPQALRRAKRRLKMFKLKMKFVSVK